VEDRGRGGVGGHEREQESERIIMVLPPPRYFTIGNWEEE